MLQDDNSKKYTTINTHRGLFVYNQLPFGISYAPSSKCEFGKARIEYLAHVLDEQGTHPLKDKMRAIQEAPALTYVKELQAFLGLVNYCGRFVP